MLNKNDELKIMRYLENNYMLEFYNIYKFDGYIEIVPKEGGEPLYFWLDEHGAIEFDDYPF